MGFASQRSAATEMEQTQKNALRIETTTRFACGATTRTNTAAAGPRATRNVPKKSSSPILQPAASTSVFDLQLATLWYNCVVARIWSRFPCDTVRERCGR